MCHSPASVREQPRGSTIKMWVPTTESHLLLSYTLGIGRVACLLTPSVDLMYPLSLA